MQKTIVSVLVCVVLVSVMAARDTYAQKKEWTTSKLELALIGKSREKVRAMIGLPKFVKAKGKEWVYWNLNVTDEQTGEQVTTVSVEWTLTSGGRVTRVGFE